MEFTSQSQTQRQKQGQGQGQNCAPPAGGVVASAHEVRRINVLQNTTIL